ncbi:hypothetical protein AVEN_70511-1 [Araneus ventricosus]|uniref:Uncharacterized protein n=1 Tax=Araneus ventricosus TaxID=182803 RepID=A0A4Y2Q6A3_ARAVE|nr:hypothetical protein AVEN_70511-1 [Araneus ventricosus]
MAHRIQCMKCGQATKHSALLVYDCGCIYHESCLKVMMKEVCPNHSAWRRDEPAQAVAAHTVRRAAIAMIAFVNNSLLLTAALIVILRWLRGAEVEADPSPTHPALP